MPYLAQTEGLIRSIYPPAPVVCGVKLHPLTLGHLAQMEALGVYDQLEKCKFKTVDTVVSFVNEFIGQVNLNLALNDD